MKRVSLNLWEQNLPTVHLLCIFLVKVILPPLSTLLSVSSELFLDIHLSSGSLFKCILHPFNLHTRDLETWLFYSWRILFPWGREWGWDLSIKYVFGNTCFTSNNANLDETEMYLMFVWLLFYKKEFWKKHMHSCVLNVLLFYDTICYFLFQKSLFIDLSKIINHLFPCPSWFPGVWLLFYQQENKYNVCH